MDAKALLDAGRLGDAIAALTQTVRGKPTDTSSRTFLFEALSFAGEYDRAIKQLDAIESQTGGAVTAGLAIHVYRQLVTAERTRQRVFAEGLLPKFFVPPTELVESYVTLLPKLATPDASLGERVADLEARAPALSGTVNGRRFSSLRDIDDRLAFVFEILHDGEYLWLPLEQVRRLEVVAPTRLRELLWLPVKVEAFDGQVGNVFMPVLYPGSSTDPDDHVRLGRVTDWRDLDQQLVYGVGQRTLLVDEEEVPLLNVRELVFDEPEKQAA